MASGKWIQRMAPGTKAPTIPSLYCPFCQNLRFNSESALITHMQKVHSDKKK